MSKKMVKGLLDLVLVVLLVLLYNKNVISMAFHEVGGLILCGLFLIHKGLNLSWIKAVGKKLFTPGVSGRSKAMMYLDIALLVCFVLIAASGLAISKVVMNGGEGERMAFSQEQESGLTAGSAALTADETAQAVWETVQAGDSPEDVQTGAASGGAQDLDSAGNARSGGPDARGGSGAWKTIHYFCSALALILVGVHVGLHGAFIQARLSAIGIKRVARWAAALLAVAAVGLGAYGLTQTSFTRWISMPFASAGSQPQRSELSLEFGGAGQTQDEEGVQSALERGEAAAESGPLPAEQSTGGAEDETAIQAGTERGEGRQQRSGFSKRAGSHGAGGGFSLITLLSVLGGFGGIVALIGMAAGLIDSRLLSKPKKAAR